MKKNLMSIGDNGVLESLNLNIWGGGDIVKFLHKPCIL